MTEPTSFTIVLNEEQQDRLVDLLNDGNYRLVSVPHTRIAAETEGCRIMLYARRGKCLVQGKGAADFVRFTLEPLILQEARLDYQDLHDPQAFEPHMGVDESGKGDFFGPLVIAAAYVDRNLVETMQTLGVKDSKRFSSDKKILDVAGNLRRLLGRRFALVTIGPAAYNRLYRQLRNVNAILAWGHARAIENLLDTVPDCPRAVSDQFGSKLQVRRALMKKGQAIDLEQRPRAESDPAVAAASILARAAFVYAIGKLKDNYGIEIPKGASEAVRTAAETLVAAKGPSILTQTAKCHFRTTDAVLSKSGHTRDVLGPDGQAVSKPIVRRA